MDTAVHDPFDERYCLTEFIAAQNPAIKWQSFGIVTACNPMGQPTSAYNNRGNTRALIRKIEELGYSALQVIGCDPNGQHEENGFAVNCTMEQARELSLMFEQLAFYMVEADQVILHATDSGSSKPVARWSQRFRTGKLSTIHEL